MQFTYLFKILLYNFYLLYYFIEFHKDLLSYQCFQPVLIYDYQ